MANKISRKRNIKTISGKQSGKAQRRTGFAGRLSRFGKTNLIIASVFVLLFAGVGTYYLHRSEADAYGPNSTYCVYYKFYEGRFPHSQCVKDIQFALTKLGIGPYGLCYGNYCDGIFGPQTYSDVLKFGNVAGITGGNGGQVGSRTWSALCVRSYQYPWVAHDMGCAQPHQYWGSL